MRPRCCHWIALQLAALGERGQRVSERATNNALAFVSEMKPRDPGRAAATDADGCRALGDLTMAWRLNHVDTIAQQDAAERALNKLARTFAGRWRC
jgi:hypothetical protein